MRRIIAYTLAMPIVLAAAGCGSPEQEVSLEEPPAVDETATDAGTAVESPPAEASPPEESPPEEGPDEESPPVEGPAEEDDGSTEPGTNAAGDEYGFGEGAAFPHPVGAYESDYQDGVEEDVVYTVDEVTLGDGQAEFILTVEVPQLERVFGLANLDVVCVSDDGQAAPAASDDPVVEAEVGIHDMEMYCEVPDSPDTMTVSLVNGEDEADFSGAVA